MKYIAYPNSSLLGPPKSILNPTFFIFFIAILSMFCSIVSYLYFKINIYACFIINVISLHLAGTVIHEASHKTAHVNANFNKILGHLSALMLGFSFPVFTRVHLQHHAHVNDPNNDPDHFVSKGGPLWLIAARFFYHEIYFIQKKLWRDNEFFEWLINRVFIVFIIIMAYYFHLIMFLLNCWFCPALVIGLLLGLFFDYLPHKPFLYRNRWKNARIYESKILNWLILGQNYHLIHHLWPSLPWYKYQEAYQIAFYALKSHKAPTTLDLFSKFSLFSFLYDFFYGFNFNISTYR
uniref:Beta-carotene hydroxylase n=2 Tax=Galdieria sulphuraria TaxID=130081 RepID=A0A075W073_GALSU|nr:beta-carotene hydroxylase [Galdieria sulphuraria]AIG92611.1 beta-carotene hydroxylase [Galdieria sulphuraria]